MSDDEREKVKYYSVTTETQSYAYSASIQTSFGGPGGGWHGPDPSDDSKIIRRSWSSSAPEWRTAVEGLSLEGNKMIRRF